MEDEKAAYLILGVENQSEIHYAMPVRDMLYDALQYAKQVEKAASSIVTNSKLKFNRKGKKVNMCQAVVEIREEGREEGREEEKKKVAQRMLKVGKLSLREIAEYAGLNIEMVKELAAQ